MAETYHGRPFIPGGYGQPLFTWLPRQSVERLLRSWFIWLADGSRVHLRPTSLPLEAEFQIRRWKTREHRVFFRWRNSAPTRASFSAVLGKFREDGRAPDVEMTPRSGKPRALVLSAGATDPLTPSWAVGLALHAFHAAGVDSSESFDLQCSAHALSMPIGPAQIALEPVSRAWTAGVKIGAMVGRIAGRNRGE